MADLQRYRSNQLSSLTNEIGVYALCDLDNVPIYLGQSLDGIRTRVRRHLTSARSDIIANRQVDVWEVAYVWAWSMEGKSKQEIRQLEFYLANEFHKLSPLMNGTIPAKPTKPSSIPERQEVQILPDDEIESRLEPVNRLPRQIQQFSNLFSYILEVKNNVELRRTLAAHFARLKKYYEDFVNQYKQ